MRFQVEHYESVDSTNLVAKSRARQGAREGTLVVADRQTAGRGRRGRGWESEPGEGLYMTLILRPEDLPACRAPELIFPPCMALCRALRVVSGLDVRIKWPNDLVASQKKIVGILLEMSALEDRVDWAVVGMGVNLRGSRIGEVVPHAASLEMLGCRDVDRDALIGRFETELSEIYGRWARSGLAGVLEEYRALSLTIGRPVRVLGGDGQYEGFAEGIAPDGALLVKRDGGAQEKVYAGDVSVRGVMGYV